MIRFGKSSNALHRHKKSFFEENERLLAENRRLAEIYAAQPRREACKNCAGSLGDPCFVKLGVSYCLCSQCGHLNGANEDTDAFCKAVYTDASGEAYARTYSEIDRQAYFERVDSIYRPKAEFLRDALQSLSIDPATLSIVDFGAGSGYFVAAAGECGFAGVRGYEVSQTQIALADTMIGAGRITRHALDEIAYIAESVKDPIVSMIGVLEHLQSSRDLLHSLKRNDHVEFLFLSVPLFSPCVIFELAFPGVMQRQLSGGHTHLYTASSLDWMCKEFSFERVGEWWFGTDLFDLYRAISVTLGQSDRSAAVTAHWSEQFLPALDAMQLEFDKRRLSSEVHLLLRTKA